MYYLDASAWVKRYWEEPGSTRMNQIFASGEVLAATGLSYVEVTAALARQHLARHIGPQQMRQLEQDLKRDWVEILGWNLSEATWERAAAFATEHRLRGADAVHLAAAWELQDSIVDTGEVVRLLAADEELLQAGRNIGLTVENPTPVMPS